jgi:gliding motility-associated-like protein
MGAGSSITTCNGNLNTAHGKIDLSNYPNCISYLPTTNYIGVDTLCIITCKNGICDIVKIIVNVKPKTDTLNVTVEQDSIVIICVPKLSDMGVGSTITTCFGSSITAHGLFDFSNYPGCIKYIPNNGYFGIDSTCIITCNNGKCDTTILILKIREKLKASIDINSAVKCKGDSSGFATIKIVGGVPPFTINWNTLTTPNSLTAANLKAGNYQVLIVDSIGRQIILNITISQPDSNLIGSYEVKDVRCFGQANGIINTTIKGGKRPYNYLWSNAATTNNISNLMIGKYNLTVLDSNGCKLVISSEINQPSQINVTKQEITDVICKDEFKGSILPTVIGGLQPYNYLWSRGDTTLNLLKAQGGKYNLIVKDSNNCVENFDFEISYQIENCKDNLIIPQGVTPNGDGVNDFFVINGIELYPNNVLRIYNRWGTLVFDANKYENNWNGQTNEGIIVDQQDGNLPTGTYFYVLELEPGRKPITGYVYLSK